MYKTPINILLVDDEKDFVEMFSLRLQEEGHQVTPAYSGQEGLDTLQKGDFDVVILDIKMPGMDGITTLRKMKYESPNVEVILLTGHGATDTAVEGMKLGAFDYMLKPANFEELLEKLQAARKRRFEQNERIRKAEAKSLLRRTGGM